MPNRIIILELNTQIAIDEDRIIQCIDTIQNLKNAQRELEDQFAQGHIGQEEFNERMLMTNQQIASQEDAIDSLNRTNEQRLQNIELLTGSITAYRGELERLTQEYDDLSVFERNSDTGEGLRAQIACLTQELDQAENGFRRAEEAIRNSEAQILRAAEEQIQNYENQILSAMGMNDGFVGSLMNMARAGGGFTGMFTSMISSAQNFGRALLALAANPVVLTLMAIVLAVQLIVAAFKKNEDATMKLDAAMAGLKNIFNILLEAMKPLTDFISDVLMEVIEGAMVAVEAMISTLAGVLSFLGFDGAAEGLNKFNDKIKDSVKNNLELAKAQKELKKAEDELARSQKSLQREMGKLKDIQDDATRSDKDRIKAAEELGRKKKESLKAELIVAEKALVVANLKLKAEGRTAEALNLQADASEKVAAIKDLIIASEKETQSAVASIRKEASDKAQQAADKERERKNKQTQERRALEDAQLAVMEEGLKKMETEARSSYDRQIEDLNKRLREEIDLTTQAQEDINERIKILKKERDKKLAKLTEENWKRESEKQLQRLEKQLSYIEENSEEAFKLQKEKLQKQQELELKEAEKMEIDPEMVKRKHQSEMDKLEQDQKRKHLEELLKIEKEGFEKRLKEIVGDGVKEQQERLKIKKEELSALKQFEGESNADFFARKKALEEEAKQLQEAYNTARIAQLKAEGMTENEAKLQLKQEELTALASLEGISEEERKNRKITLEADEKALRQQVLVEEFDIASAKVQAYGKMFDDMGSILEEFGANSAALGVFSKAMALAEIGINTAKAIAVGLPPAMAQPFPLNIAAVATTVGTIMSNVANAKKLLSKEKTPEAPKFVTGGLVTGEGSGTSDSITARLSSGESVITAMGTQMFGPMLSAFNQIGGGVPISSANSGQQAIGQEMLTEAFRKALDSMPTPVVAVSEINNVNKRVEVLESYGTL